MQYLSGDEDIDITLFQGMTGLESLRGAWDEIVSGMIRRHYFHLWEWHYSYLKCLESDPHSQIYFLLNQGGMPLAILPLHDTQISFGGIKLRTLSLPNHSHLWLGDIICRREALDLPLFQILSQYLRNQGKNWDLILLCHLLVDACALHVVDKSPPLRFLRRHEGRCNFIDTTVAYESFFAGLSKKSRESLKRARQHLSELPEVEFAITHDSLDLEEKLEVFMDVEASGWKGTVGSGTAIKLDASLRDFYSTLTRLLSTSGGVFIITLSTAGKCIAAQFCLRLDDTVYTLKIGYDEGYKRYAPGNLLRDFLIKRSTEDRNIKYVNFTTDTEWHKDWNPKSYDKSKLYIFNATLLGIMGFWVLKSYPILREYYHNYIKCYLPKRMQQ